MPAIEEIKKRREDFIRPSALKPISLCPGRPTMEAAVSLVDKPEPESVEASGGTKGHDIVANALRTYKDGHTADAAREELELLCDQQLENSFERFKAFTCFNYAIGLIEKYEIDRDNILIEFHMHIDGMANGGTADIILVEPYKRVHVIDWKLGFLDQGEADENDQTQAYAWAASDFFQCTEVWTHLVQPHLEADMRFSVAKHDAETLRSNWAWSQSIISDARSDTAELVPGYEQCVYCSALLRCGRANGAIMYAMQLASTMEPATKQDRADRLGYVKLYKKLCERVEKAEKQAMLDGDTIPGWMLKPSGCIRSVNNIGAAYQVLGSSRFLEVAKVGIGDLTKEEKDALYEAGAIDEKEKSPSIAPDRRG